MDKPIKRKGVAGALDAFTGGADGLRPITREEARADEPVTSETVVEPEATHSEPEVRKEAAPKPRKVNPEPVQRVMGRRGRPPGQKEKGSEPAKPKQKTTLLIEQALWERYVNRSYQFRCTLGKLVEQALLDYEKRKWPESRRESDDTSGKSINP